MRSTRKSKHTRSSGLPARTNTRWILHDVGILIRRTKDGIPLARTARVLRRSTDSCRSMLNRLLKGKYQCPPEFLDLLEEIIEQRLAPTSANSATPPPQATQTQNPETAQQLEALSKAVKLLEEQNNANSNLGKTIEKLNEMVNHVDYVNRAHYGIEQGMESLADRMQDSAITLDFGVARLVAQGKLNLQSLERRGMTEFGIARILQMAEDIKQGAGSGQ